MSLELTIENLTVAFNTLIDSINKQGIRAPIAPMVAPVAVAAAPVAAPVPVAVVAPVAAPIAAPVMPAPPVFTTATVAPAMNPSVTATVTSTTANAPVMPAPPAFMAPAFGVSAITVAAGAPFTDGKGLIDYVMASYKALGAAKGANIQGVLVGMGYQNINDVKPEHYAALFAGIEALKG